MWRWKWLRWRIMSTIMYKHDIVVLIWIIIVANAGWSWFVDDGLIKLQLPAPRYTGVAKSNLQSCAIVQWLHVLPQFAHLYDSSLHTLVVWLSTALLYKPLSSKCPFWFHYSSGFLITSQYRHSCPCVSIILYIYIYTHKNVILYITIPPHITNK